MATVHQRPQEIEAAVARAACAVAAAEVDLARARRGLRRAWGAYAAWLARPSTEDLLGAADRHGERDAASDLTQLMRSPAPQGG